MNQLEVIKQRHFLSSFLRHLACLLKRDAPIAEGISILTRDTPPGRIKMDFTRMGEEIAKGASISKAMEGCPRLFGKDLLAVVRVGEESERLPSLLNFYVSKSETDVGLRNRLLSSLSYPITLFSVMLIIFMGHSTFVIPPIREILLAVGTTLPLPFQFLCEVKTLLSTFLPFIIGVGGSVVIILFILCQTRTGRAFLERVILLLPGLGGLWKKRLEVHFCHLFTILLEADTSTLRALELTGQGVTSRYLKKGIGRTIDGLNRGMNLSEAMEKSGCFSKTLIWMTSLGEAREALGDTLNQLGGIYREELETRIYLLANLIERAGNVILGLFVALFVISSYLGLFAVSTITYD